LECGVAICKIELGCLVVVIWFVIGGVWGCEGFLCRSYLGGGRVGGIKVLFLFVDFCCFEVCLEVGLGRCL